MTRFRNLAVDPAAPVSAWGVEGMLAAIDRGTSADWGRIAQEIRQAPHGEAAADLEQALDLAEDLGVAAALRNVLHRSRCEASQEFAERLRSWVNNSGYSRAEIAQQLGTSRSRLSTYESGKVTPSAVTADKVRALATRRRSHLV